MALPRPTSSASSAPRDNGGLNAKRAAPTWCGLRHYCAPATAPASRSKLSGGCRSLSSYAKYLAWWSVAGHGARPTSAATRTLAHGAIEVGELNSTGHAAAARRSTCCGARRASAWALPDCAAQIAAANRASTHCGASCSGVMAPTLNDRQSVGQKIRVMHGLAQRPCRGVAAVRGRQPCPLSRAPAMAPSALALSRSILGHTPRTACGVAWGVVFPARPELADNPVTATPAAVAL